MNDLIRKFPGEVEYHQAVREVIESIEEVYNDNPQFESALIIERLIEPDRTFLFKVPWEDDEGNFHLNRGFRVQFNNAIGPYKGGLRFHSNVNLSIMKFLGFEQIFKNSLTSLPLGGAKGGSDFNPKGKSNREIMRFCHSFMLELWRIIGSSTDVPAGDIGVGGREIGYLYGMYKKLSRENTGVFTGKGLNWGGSLVRPEATGFGVIFFTREMLKAIDETLIDKRVAISGFGNVAWGTALKATEFGAKVITLSGPDGYIYIPDGLTAPMIEYMLELRASNEDIIKPFIDEFEGIEFVQGARPWEVPCDIAIPCATQNELDKEAAESLVKNGVICLTEAANMPCTPDAIDHFQQNHILFSPGKASNAGGVATSGLEMTQNSMKISWPRQEVEDRLEDIMIKIHSNCVKYGKGPDGYVDYVKGANIAGFLKVANSMIDQGLY